jgi:hypothetical protein
MAFLRTGWAPVLLCAVATLLARPAFADVPVGPSGAPRPEDEATAKRSFETGLKLYGEGAYAEALSAFETSYRLGGRPSALKNVAQCHRNLKQFVDAYDAYELLLNAHGDKLAPADKRAVAQALDELSVLTGTIAIGVSEAGADVELDGKNIGRSPLARAKRTSVGAHRVRVTKPGFEPFDSNVNVGSQENKKVEVALSVDRKMGHVIVHETQGRDVRVVIDGDDRGKAPWEGELPAGEHTIEVRGSSFSSDPRKFTVGAKERLDVALDALPLTGHLRVSTVPANAEISVDGKDVGAGVWEGDLPAGIHRIEATLAGQPAQVRQVTLARGQNVLQEIPILGAVGPIDYRGIYIQLTLAPYFMLGGQTTNHADGIAVGDIDRLVIGGGATVRAGYSFGWFSAELIGTFLVEHREEHQQVPQSTSGASTIINDGTTAPNFFLGIGPRVTTKHELIRFTFALAPGIAIRDYEFHRNLDFGGVTAPGATSQAFSAGYTAFALNAEAGVLLGSTPGAKFFLGAHAWVDFPPDDVIVGPDTITPLPNSAFRAPGRGIVVVDSPQFFVGPVFGLRIGN